MGLSDFPVFGDIQHLADFTLGGSGFDTDYPLSNLSNLEFAKVARVNAPAQSPSVDAVITGVSTDGSPITVQAFTLAAHTAGYDATGRLELFSDNAFTSAVYSGAPERLIPQIYTYEGRSWYQPMFWTGQPSPAELAGQVRHKTFLLDAAYAIKSWRLTLSSPENFDIGALFTDEIWQPSSGIEVGTNFGYRHYTETDVLPGGLRRHDAYAPAFTVSGQIPYLPNDEAQGRGLSMLRRFSTHTPFLFIMHPTRPRTWLDMTKIVNFVEPGLMAAATYNRDTFPINLEEYKG